MTDRTSPAALVGLVAITTTFTVGLHWLGGSDGLAIDWGDPIAWMSNATGEDVVGATLRSIGLIIGYWVLFTTTLYLATGVRGPVRRPQWIATVTLPGIRKIVDRSLATALAVSIAATPIAPVLATEPSPVSVVGFEATDGIPVPHVRLPRPATSEEASDVPFSNTPPLASPRPPTIAPIGTSAGDAHSGTHTVEAGDNLWRVAALHLRDNRDGAVTDGDVVEYWRRLIEANEDTLRSGDPNLIYPGELIMLPPVESAP